MAYHVEWNEDLDVAICRLLDAVEGDEICAAIDELAQLTSSHGETINVCWDCRDIRLLAISPSEERQIIDRMNRFATRHPHGRTAIVTTRRIDRAMAKLLVLRAHEAPRNRETFTAMDEAQAWTVETSQQPNP